MKRQQKTARCMPMMVTSQQEKYMACFTRMHARARLCLHVHHGLHLVRSTQRSASLVVRGWVQFLLC